MIRTTRLHKHCFQAYRKQLNRIDTTKKCTAVHFFYLLFQWLLCLLAAQNAHRSPLTWSTASFPALALQQIRRAVEQGLPQAPVLADAVYGTDTQFREAMGEL
jgi:SRSO17 transposase